MGPIIPGPLADLLVGQSLAGGGGNGGGRSSRGTVGGGGGVLAVKGKKVGAPWSDARVRMQYNAHLPALYL